MLLGWMVLLLIQVLFFAILSGMAVVFCMATEDHTATAPSVPAGWPVPSTAHCLWCNTFPLLPLVYLDPVVDSWE